MESPPKVTKLRCERAIGRKMCLSLFLFLLIRGYAHICSCQILQSPCKSLDSTLPDEMGWLMQPLLNTVFKLLTPLALNLHNLSYTSVACVLPQVWAHWGLNWFFRSDPINFCNLFKFPATKIHSIFNLFHTLALKIMKQNLLNLTHWGLSKHNSPLPPQNFNTVCSFDFI
jgi:hypothetical protein